MEAKLYVILGSHACRTGMLMLEHKGIAYERVELPTGFHPFLLRLRGLGGNRKPFRRFDDRSHLMLGTADRMGTVPTLVLDGRVVKTNRAIARFLDEIKPEPPLFPAEPELRREVEEAERWGDDVFQMTARRVALAAGRRGTEGIVDGGGKGRLGTLLWRRPRMREAGVRFLGIAVFAAGEEAERELLAELPAQLDRIDRWIEAGILNGEQLNAADFMIVTSLALLSYVRDLRPEIERRPAIGLLDRVLPEPSSPRAPALAA